MSDLENELRSYLENGGTQKYINNLVKDILSEQSKIKVVINKCHTGFELSSFACEILDIDFCLRYDLSRTDSDLIAMVETHGSNLMSGPHSQLEICECPLGSDWTISEYEGYETLVW